LTENVSNCPKLSEIVRYYPKLSEIRIRGYSGFAHTHKHSKCRCNELSGDPVDLIVGQYESVIDRNCPNCPKWPEIVRNCPKLSEIRIRGYSGFAHTHKHSKYRCNELSGDPVDLIVGQYERFATFGSGWPQNRPGWSEWGC
jgi:hypothetical protein